MTACLLQSLVEKPLEKPRLIAGAFLKDSASVTLLSDNPIIRTVLGMSTDGWTVLVPCSVVKVLMGD